MNWQDMLWVAVHWLNGWPDLMFAVAALITALVSFSYLVLGQRWSALVLARGLVGIGLLMYFYSGLNSGWQKPAGWMMVSGLALSNFLIITRWCERPPGWFRHVLRDVFSHVFSSRPRAVKMSGVRKPDR